MNKQIEVVIDTDGEIKIDAVGFSGPDCAKATKFLEQALGTVKDTRKKPEFAQQALAQRKATQ
jgi:hypothetical protein